MNNNKLFDKCQLIIAISTIASLIISTILFVVMVLTGTIIRDESGAITDITYNSVIQSIFTAFFLLQFVGGVWFVARILTYKMRIKEEDSL